MGIAAKELKQWVIKPVLHHLGVRSQAATWLLLGTAARESDLGYFLHHGQGENGGIGIYQITPSEHHALWDGYLARDHVLASRIRGLASQREFLVEPDAELATNLSYATAIAWELYRQNGLQLPRHPTPENLAECWLRYFPAHDPSRSVREFVDAFQRHLIDLHQQQAA